jgi:hypothetical protein
MRRPQLEKPMHFCMQFLFESTVAILIACSRSRLWIDAYLDALSSHMDASEWAAFASFALPRQD